MRTKDEILREIGSLAKENPRGGIIPDLADVIMIEVFLDIRDILNGILDHFNSWPDDSEGFF